MIFWLIAGAMTTVAIAVLLLPLLRPAGRLRDSSSHDLAVYRDQLAEVARDQERGLLSEDQAAAARLEIERRMLAAAERGGGAKEAASRTPEGRAWAVAIAVALIVPIGAFALYSQLGAPGVPGMPFAERQGVEQEPGDLAALAEKMASRLRQQGGSENDWLLLGRTYAELGRYAEAAQATREAIALGSEEVESRAFLGEMLVAANGGTVVPEARGAFAWVLERDRGNVRGLYYAGLALSQDGRTDEALDLWVALARASPPDAPWQTLLKQQIESAAATLGIAPPDIGDGVAAAGSPPPAGEASAAAPGPTQADVAAAAEMSDEERQAFIRSMVERLASRLEQEPDDFEGWLRLARAYSVLGEGEKAESALGQAEKLVADLPADAPERAMLDQARAALRTVQ